MYIITQAMTAKKLLVPLETAALILIIGAVNLVFADDPGFASLYYIPYLLASVLIAAIYGAWWGGFCVSHVGGGGSRRRSRGVAPHFG